MLDNLGTQIQITIMVVDLLGLNIYSQQFKMIQVGFHFLDLAAADESRYLHKERHRAATSRLFFPDSG